jgi:membrane protein DedA with SNARE-associated domain
MEIRLTASFIDSVLEWLKPLFSSWGYLIVLGGVFLESIFLTGWLAPGTAVILLASFYAAHGELNVFGVAAVAFAGALLGDNVGYAVGHRVGEEILQKYQHRRRLKKGMETSQRWFSRYGGATVLLGRMVSGVDAFIPLTAGMGNMPYWKYMLFDFPGIAIWVGIITVLGYFFGESWETIVKVLDWLGWGLLAIVISIVVVAYLARRRKGRRTVASEEGGEPTP